jgi:uridine phosphorylase
MDADAADIPLLELDPAREAMIEPARRYRRRGEHLRAVVCFFREVTMARSEGCPVVVKVPSENGPFPIFELATEGGPVWVFHPPVGASMSAAALELLIASGVDRVIVCGGAGNLEAGHALGQVVVPTGAVRDEGTSFHYLPPSRTVDATPAAVDAIVAACEAAGVRHTTGLTWTTDGLFRETPAKVAARRAEGCLTVEMEAAAMFAVAHYRGITIGQILYAGDDLSGDEWDHRGWDKERSIRERLFDLALDAVLRL